MIMRWPRRTVAADTTAARRALDQLEGRLNELSRREWTVVIPVHRTIRARLRAAWSAFTR